MRRLFPILAIVMLAVTAPAVHAEKNSTAKPAKAAKALQGYCPVAYVAMGKAMKGDSKISSTLDGRKYLFANAEAKKMFDADPAKFRVGYDEWCATAVSMGQKMKSKPTLFTVHEGATYLFSSADAKKMFDANPTEVASKADAAWASMEK